MSRVPMQKRDEENYSPVKPPKQAPTPNWEVVLPVDPTGGAHTADVELVAKAVAHAKQLGVGTAELRVLLDMARQLHANLFRQLTTRQRWVCNKVLVGELGALTRQTEGLRGLVATKRSFGRGLIRTRVTSKE